MADADRRWLLAYLKRDHAGWPLACRYVVAEAAFRRETGRGPAAFAAALEALRAGGRVRPKERARTG